MGIGKCGVCEGVEDCRPYGEGGALVCFGCAFATPEAEQRTTETFIKALDACGLAAVLAEDGPQPLLPVCLRPFSHRDGCDCGAATVLR